MLPVIVERVADHGGVHKIGDKLFSRRRTWFLHQTMRLALYFIVGMDAASARAKRVGRPRRTGFWQWIRMNAGN
jgi:hypothetical protein